MVMHIAQRTPKRCLRSACPPCPAYRYVNCQAKGPGEFIRVEYLRALRPELQGWALPLAPEEWLVHTATGTLVPSSLWEAHAPERHCLRRYTAFAESVLQQHPDWLELPCCFWCTGGVAGQADRELHNVYRLCAQQLRLEGE